MSKANDLARLLNASGELQAADIEDGVITAAKLASTLDLSGKTVTLPSGTGGKVLQVVHAVTDTVASTGSTSFVDSPITVNITPTNASSKMLVFGSVVTGGTRTTNDNQYSAFVRIYESTTSSSFPTNGTDNFGFVHEMHGSNINGRTGGSIPVNCLHTHGQSSQLTYKIQYRVGASGQTCAINSMDGNNWDSQSSITVMEISG